MGRIDRVWWCWLPFLLFGLMLGIGHDRLDPRYWSAVEIWWTAASLAMLPSAIYGLVEAGRDIEAALQRPGRTARLQAARWWFSAALLFVSIFLGFAIIGILAGSLPPREVDIADEQAEASAISAAVFFIVGGLASACMLWGLWTREQIRRALEQRDRPRF